MNHHRATRECCCIPGGDDCCSSSSGLYIDGTYANETLPYEVLLHIFGHLSMKELGVVCVVCKFWKEASEADCLWKSITLSLWGGLGLRDVQRAAAATTSTSTTTKDTGARSSSSSSSVASTTTTTSSSSSCPSSPSSSSSSALRPASVTSPESFQALEKLRLQILRIKEDSTVPIVFLGSHADRESQRQVSQDEALFLAEKLNCGWLECSAKTGQNVNDAFELIVRMINRWRALHPAWNTPKSRQEATIKNRVKKKILFWRENNRT
ncbi:Ras family protein [Acanthamoeba castellanii str. Neff]|uniref:Ras family protein n=1 Tax=Acanthamoeba castellanii (strain ATCC 30010 / Neff) TaxID=1257118 RepID=L8GVM2_ACACF|nr:Ras family protein [Acanthamoeba castellanii str. Neff]ELR16997.1 Ras family protein [Acanthamoeba castellanii str. Neff]